VRAPDAWHEGAVGAAYSSGDKEWRLTAVFCMRWVGGFDRQILDALKSADPQVHFEAVQAAGEWELDAAWPHVVKLAQDASTPKALLIAAIGAVGSIRPAEALEILVELADSEDEEIAEAADEAMSMAEGFAEEDDEEEDKWIN
jgi:HEAT repeat protein